MMSSVIHWFTALSQREKILIGILGLLLFAALGFYGIFRPVAGAVSDARVRFEQSVERHGRIETKVAALAEATRDKAPEPTGPVDVIISQSAGETGMAMGRIDPQGNGRVDLVIDSAKPTVLFGWLSGLEAKGIFVEVLNMGPADSGTVTGNITLHRSAPQ